MEDGVKADPAKPKEARFLSKAGWVKKASGRFISVYKDRYIHLEKTEVVVYEDEDLKTCLQRLDLENFEKCLELRSVFKKKNRLILIREPKSANKIHDIKIQVQTPEEKDSWIKALSEGISRAKNKILDEIKVDEGNNLDHVTRTRPKGNRARRPPTRIHMKGVTNLSSEGHVPLDLDVPDSALSNGNHYVNVEIQDPPKKGPSPPMPPTGTSDSTKIMWSGSLEPEEPQTVVEPEPKKKIFKPPMPPTKDSKAVAAAEDKPSTQADPDKTAPGPPKPPSKDLKPSLSERDPVEEPGEKTDPPMTPPNKPMSSPKENPALVPTPAPETRPPTLPPKKPSKNPDREGSPLLLEGTSEGTSETEEKVSEMDPSSSLPSLSLPTVQKPEGEDNSESAEEQPEVFEVTPEPISDATPGPAEGQPSETSTTPPSLASPLLDSTRKNLTPMLPLKKKPLKLAPPKPPFPSNLPQPENPATVSTDTIVTHHEDRSSSKMASVPAADSANIEETSGATTESHNDVPTVVLTVCEPEAVEKDCGFPAERREEISEHSTCHSDGDSVDSGSEDTLASSTFALRGSQVGLDSFYTSEDDVEDYNNPEQIRDPAPPGTISSQVASSVQINPIRAKPPILTPRPQIPLRPNLRSMSASTGDLLSNISEETEMRPRSKYFSQTDSGNGLNEVKNLEMQIALGLEHAEALLSCTSQTQEEGLGKNMPEDLLAEAMEKLRMANHFLREAKTLEQPKCPKSRNHRSSW